MGDLIATDAVEQVNKITRSSNRTEILMKLQRSGSVHRDELMATCDASRTTLQRNLDALVEKGWIKQTNRAYELTPPGREVTEDLLDLLETVEITDRLQPFLEWIPAEEFDLDINTLADGTIVTISTGDPYVVENKYIDQLRSVTTIRAVLPSTSLRAWEVAHERILDGELECEVVVGSNVGEVLQTSEDYQPLLEDLLETNGHDVFVLEERAPYFVGLMGNQVQIGVSDSNEVPRALVESDREEVFDWAEQTYERYRQQATPLKEVV